MHGGAHKLNNTLGQALLARYMGKERLIAETGAGQHGCATAIAGAAMGLSVDVYMGKKDVERQKMNVYRMQLLGAKVIPVESGSMTLKDATNEALRDWAESVEYTHYLLGSVVGPHPFPTIVRDFQRVIGRETKIQILEKEGKLPDSVVACAGGGSNAIGIFYEFLDDPDVTLHAIEAGGRGTDKPGKDGSVEHSASLSIGEDGVLHGAMSKLLQDGYGQIFETHSIAPGLDYPGVGPELASLVEGGRVLARTADDRETLQAFHTLSEVEGIIPALESAHAIAYVVKHADELGDVVIVNLSGRGDKDVETISKMESMGEGLP